MKVLLVCKSKMMESLGVMYLSAVIKKAGHQCKIVDLKEAYDVAFQFKPDIVGFSIMTGDRDRFYYLKMKLMAIGTMKYIVGGPDPTFFPEGYDWADEICKGEGENWLNSILNIVSNKSVHYDLHSPYKGIDDIPWPDRTDFPNMKIRDFIASRGCPFSCTYCFNSKWNDLFPEYKKVRVRDPKDVAMEVHSVNPEYAFFQDSCFGVNMDWMREFAREILDKAECIRKGNSFHPQLIPYQCNLRPELVTEERVFYLSRSGCVAIRMALETASGRLRKLVGRNSYDVSDIMYAAGLLRKNGIMFMIQNILGIPSATIEEDLDTLRINVETQPTYSWVSIYQPYPGTVLGDKCKEMGWYKGDYSDITDSFFETSHLEITSEYREQLEILQKIFALCVGYKYMPKPEELTYKNLPNLIHKITRKDGDSKLYLGLLK